MPDISTMASIRTRSAVPADASQRLRVLTWHVHGNYLYYLAHTAHEFYLPVGLQKPGYQGLTPGFDWPDNIHEVAVSDLPEMHFDCILYQSLRHYLVDQYDILSPAQRCLPRIYLEHDPPQEHPTNTRHPVNDPATLLVHVTHFNRLMWDSGVTPVKVIEHGVAVPSGVRYSGEIPKGLVVINNLSRRGRRLGLDIFNTVRKEVPLDLVGMDSEALGGLGEINHTQLPALMGRYRLFFNPIRYTSLGLAVCEAMTVGMPVVALATTEMTTAIETGVSGYLHTDLDRLIEQIRTLLRDQATARRLGEGARRSALKRFNITAFTQVWQQTISGVVKQPLAIHS